MDIAKPGLAAERHLAFDAGILVADAGCAAEQCHHRGPEVTGSCLINYRRGRIHVLDVEALHDSCCECYDAINGHFRRLTGWVPGEISISTKIIVTDNIGLFLDDAGSPTQP